ncbi:hypothetical protein F2Q68_00013815 [Brassica cretica]|uniref:Uncharacterized protein n=1 Tax=Brassica cretica TaxID=69181 RepID=A0A8S9HKF7_BRACR|nr:hypothetical protein F2Q68_00013815 [Brassica cretica]
MSRKRETVVEISKPIPAMVSLRIRRRISEMENSTACVGGSSSINVKPPAFSRITGAGDEVAGGGDGTTGGTDEDLEAALFLASSISDSVSASNPIAALTGAVSFSDDDCGERKEIHSKEHEKLNALEISRKNSSPITLNKLHGQKTEGEEHKEP